MTQSQINTIYCKENYRKMLKIYTLFFHLHFSFLLLSAPRDQIDHRYETFDKTLYT